MGSIEDELTPHARDALELFGETLTIHNESYAGEDPDEGTAMWTDDPPIEVLGRITESGRPTEESGTSGRRVLGEYLVYVSSTADIRDGLHSEQERASAVVDEDGYRYDILRVDDEGNGLYRCQAELETP